MLSNDVLNKIRFLVGDADTVKNMDDVPSRTVFDPEILSFLSRVSKILMRRKDSRLYSDVVTFAFWIRDASLKQIKGRYFVSDTGIHMGRGMTFHIAPSNVPVNFAYSLVTGLLAGNPCIVRVPSKEFGQVGIIAEAIVEALDEYEHLKSFISLIRYNRDRDINDALSSIAAIRIIWGGDATIEEIRRSPLPPRSFDITFADRYSIAIIDSGKYLLQCDPKKVAQDFYNDTYFSDQNACTSPRFVIWIGERKEDAKERFWNELYEIVKSKYSFQDIQAVNKLTSLYRASAACDGIRMITGKDNLIMRVSVSVLKNELTECIDNSGYFYEYDCGNVMEIEPLCNNRHCQTIGMIGDRKWLMPLLMSGVKGVDRVVEIGKTMDFDLVWDGYELIHQMTRRIAVDY